MGPITTPGGHLQRAWELAYLDPPAAHAAALLALDAAPPASPDAGWSLWHLALADIRTEAATTALRHLDHARAIFKAQELGRGLALCAEIDAMAARQAGDAPRSRNIQDGVDHGPDPAFTHFDRFLAHHSRALTARLLGDGERALSHTYDALAATETCDWHGPRITALGLLGTCHWDLFNLDDARALGEQALALAREAGARSIVTQVAAHLIVVHHAAGQPEQALAMARFLTDHPQEQVPGALKQVALPIALAFLANGETERAESWISTETAAARSDGTNPRFWAWLCARCQLLQGDADSARELAERSLRTAASRPGLPYDLMELLRVACDACEAAGDPAAALAHARRAQKVYEELVGSGAKARLRALRASHEYSRVEAQLSVAQQVRAEAEKDRRSLVDLNRALEAKVAETELLHAQLREQVLRDPLTGLHNRRYLFEVGPGLMELARRDHQPLSVALLDLDHFKNLNDSFGHAAGDAVLQHFATLLQSQLRRSDVLCRYGGEEFVVLMPDVDIEQAAATMTQVLERFHAGQVDHRRRRLPPNTFSAGVATFPMHGDRLEHLLGRADKALYRAKDMGRARVEHATHTGFATLT